MLANSFLAIILFSALSFVVCAIGVLVAYFLQGPQTALELFQSYTFHFNGILIIGFGYGLLHFIRRTGEKVFNSIFTILDIPDNVSLQLVGYSNWITDRKRQHFVSIFLTMIGGAILWNCGYPLSGFSKYFLAFTSISMFYVAGQMSGFFIASILTFRKLDEVSRQIKLKRNFSSYELNNLNMCFLVITTLGVIALYLAFRGTVTANFVVGDDSFVFRKLLIYPMVAFLPGILFTSFYYRYVLRKIQENAVVAKFTDLEKKYSENAGAKSGTKESLEIEHLILDIRDKLNRERQQTPLLSLKDSPTVLVSLVFILQFIIYNDETIRNFFVGFMK